MTTRTLQVDVTDLAETMDFAVPDGMTSYLDLRNGKLVHASADAAVDDHLLPIPPFEKNYRYGRMVQFAATVDPELSTVFEVALGGDGAFRRFKNLVNQHGLAESWGAFQLRLDRAEAMAWLARHDISVIDVSRRIPVAPGSAAPATVGLVDVLLLGAVPGGTDLVDGRVLRRVPADSPEHSRELFWSLAREIGSQTGATLPGTTDSPSVVDTLDAGRFHLRRHDSHVDLSIDVPAPLVSRFS
ncbi:MAG TPA: hypothetical protein VHE35_03655 [Kofleriaceae bacterium]|nr:hypothetical protein [Kofleriaceae bacterium]